LVEEYLADQSSDEGCFDAVAQLIFGRGPGGFGAASRRFGWWESPDGAMSAGRGDGRQVDGNGVNMMTDYTVSSLS